MSKILKMNIVSHHACRQDSNKCVHTLYMHKMLFIENFKPNNIRDSLASVLCNIQLSLYYSFEIYLNSFTA